ncbi:MAG TPA: hypothetical protein VGG74_36580, partial [Kofleriaceae bacterium]
SILSTPPSNVPWLLPVLAAIGGLGLLLVVGRRFVTRGAVAVAAAPKLEGEDEHYADKLDDELADTD